MTSTTGPISDVAQWEQIPEAEHENYKRCSRGNHILLRSEFGKNRSAPDGLQTWCKACSYNYKKEREAINRGKKPTTTVDRLISEGIMPARVMKSTVKQDTVVNTPLYRLESLYLKAQKAKEVLSREEVIEAQQTLKEIEELLGEPVTA